MSQGRGVASLGELSDELLVRHRLAGIVAAHAEQVAEEGRLIDPGQQHDVPGKGRLDERVADVASLASDIIDERHGSRVPTEEQEPFQVPAERRGHLSKRQ